LSADSNIISQLLNSTLERECRKVVMATVTVPPYLNMQEDVNGLHRAFKGELTNHLH
jgi:hypothetical protein